MPFMPLLILMMIMMLPILFWYGAKEIRVSVKATDPEKRKIAAQRPLPKTLLVISIVFSLLTMVFLYMPAFKFTSYRIYSLLTELIPGWRLLVCISVPATILAFRSIAISRIVQNENQNR